MFSLRYISAQKLKDLLNEHKSDVAIIDVREDDFVGGNIRDAVNIPSNQLDKKMEELIDLTKQKKAVVFHCTYSQSRGPNAAKSYQEALPAEELKKKEVYVLENGFRGWQKLYGSDTELTENYDSKVWQNDFD